MRAYYFTFGSSGQIYEGGWIRILAYNLKEAQRKFKKRYGSEAVDDIGLLRYAGSYTEEEFKKDDMFREGNFGAFLHETLY